MVAPAIVAAGIVAAGALESQRRKSAAASGQSKMSRSFALHQGNIDWQRQNEFRSTEYQTRVKDAQAAGLHPLFALGTGGSTFSPTSRTPGGSSGSFAGDGLATASRAIGRGITGAASNRREQELHVLRVQKMGREIALDDAALMKAASDRKLAEQSALYWGDTQAGITGPQAKTYPYGTKSGPALNMRPLTATARQSVPQYVEAVGPRGRRKILNPETGLDEVSQVEYVARPWVDYVGSHFSNKFRPKMTSPRSYYHYWKQYYKRKRR